MQLMSLVDQLEGLAEKCGEGLGFASCDRQSAADLRSIAGESTDDDMATDSECGSRGGQIRAQVRIGAEKMHDGAIVPEIKTRIGPLCARDVADAPVDGGRARAESLSCNGERRVRQIEYADPTDTAIKQIVDQRRCAATDVDYARMRIEPGILQHPQ